MSTTIVVVKYVTSRPCRQCDKPLRDNRLQVRAQIARKGGRPLSFGIGVFCSVRCLMRFAAEKEKGKHATLRGWAFGDAGRGL